MKKIFALAVAGLMAVAAKADYSSTSTYFYWNVDSATDPSISGFSYASLLYSVGGSAWTAAGVSDLTVGGNPATRVGNEGNDTTESVFANLGATKLDSSYSFMAAVYNASGDKIGQSEAVAYNAATMFDYIYTDMGKTPTSAYSFSVAAVPEPTSGLLLLLGVAGLALRRKKR